MHGAESLLSEGAMAISRAYAAESLRPTTSALPAAVADGSDLEARSRMLTWPPRPCASAWTPLGRHSGRRDPCRCRYPERTRNSGSRRADCSAPRKPVCRTATGGARRSRTVGTGGPARSANPVPRCRRSASDPRDW
ncbi:hypothetical protein HPY32_39415 [Nocardia terpenica]|nr:hypothetical protein [Nocardia terpenica]